MGNMNYANLMRGAAIEKVSTVGLRWYSKGPD